VLGNRLVCFKVVDGTRWRWCRCPLPAAMVYSQVVSTSEELHSRPKCGGVLPFRARFTLGCLGRCEPGMQPSANDLLPYLAVSSRTRELATGHMYYQLHHTASLRTPNVVGITVPLPRYSPLVHTRKLVSSRAYCCAGLGWIVRCIPIHLQAACR